MPTRYSDRNEPVVFDPKFADSVKNEVLKLHVFHAKPLSPEKAKIFADELIATDLDPKHIIAGLRGLQNDETLQEITIWKLKRAASSAANEGVKSSTENCEECRGNRGLISAVRVTGEMAGYSAAFRCICEYADQCAQFSAKDARQMARWPGYTTFDHDGVTWTVWKGGEKPARLDVA